MQFLIGSDLMNFYCYINLILANLQLLHTCIVIYLPGDDLLTNYTNFEPYITVREPLPEECVPFGGGDLQASLHCDT